MGKVRHLSWGITRAKGEINERKAGIEMSVSKETIKRGQPLLEGRDWLSSPAKRAVLEAHSHPFLQTM